MFAPSHGAIVRERKIPNAHRKLSSLNAPSTSKTSACFANIPVLNSSYTPRTYPSYPAALSNSCVP